VWLVSKDACDPFLSPKQPSLLNRHSWGRVRGNKINGREEKNRIPVCPLHLQCSQRMHTDVPCQQLRQSMHKGHRQDSTLPKIKHHLPFPRVGIFLTGIQTSLFPEVV